MTVNTPRPGPESGQDDGQVERLMAGLVTALSDGLLVFATHDIDLALRYATRALLLHDGHLLRDGAPLDVLRDLPAEIPLVLPPLARWCVERGVPYRRAAELAPLRDEVR